MQMNRVLYWWAIHSPIGLLSSADMHQNYQAIDDEATDYIPAL
jgi:hypothetical protein